MPNSVLTIPNILTLLRIFAVPVFAIAFWYGEHWAAFAIFIAAGLTDMLDGFIARHFNQRSALGAILDPAADKILMTTAFALLAWRTEGLVAPMPPWVAMLAISRDVLISVAAALSAGHFDLARFKPSLLGKITTGIEVAVIALGLLFNALGTDLYAKMLLPWLYKILVIFVIASGIHYFFRSAHVENH